MFMLRLRASPSGWLAGWLAALDNQLDTSKSSERTCGFIFKLRWCGWALLVSCSRPPAVSDSGWVPDE